MSPKYWIKSKNTKCPRALNKNNPNEILKN